MNTSGRRLSLISIVLSFNAVWVVVLLMFFEFEGMSVTLSMLASDLTCFYQVTDYRRV